MQHDFEILTDSTCDLPLDELNELGVEMVPLHVFVRDSCYLDQIEMKPEEFYDRMAAAKELPHSSQPAPSSFGEAYARMAAAGAKRILSIHIAAALSGTANSAELAAKDAPVEVCVWDTRTATMVHGMLVKEACRMRDAGETLEATLAHLEELRKQSYLIFTLDTLENIVKNGRCSRAKGLMSSVLNIKAVLAVDDDGTLSPVGKGRGSRRAFESLATLVEAKFGPGADLTASLLTVRNQAGCDEMVDIIRKRGIKVNVLATYDAGPVIATHTGSGLVGFGAVPTSALYKG